MHCCGNHYCFAEIMLIILMKCAYNKIYEIQLGLIYILRSEEVFSGYNGQFAL